MTALEAPIDRPEIQFSDLDRQFAGLMERLEGDARPELRLAAALVSQRRSEGDVCLELARLAGQEFIDEAGLVHRVPTLALWRVALRSARTVVGSPGDVKPLILDEHDRLYLRRYWWYEREVATALESRGRLKRETLELDSKRLTSLLQDLFPEAGESGPNWQRVAAFAACQRRLCVISGGPGTGKTTTVVRILALLTELASPQTLRLAIAAPTGKAAARLQESLRTQRADLLKRYPSALRLPDEVKTLHRLLGPIPGSPYFRHDPANPLPIDVLVVDEASMVDLALMAKVLRAVPSHARIILLGDQDQLASVEAGNVLGDISADPELNCYSPEFAEAFRATGGGELPRRTGPERALADTLVQLRKSHRFGRGSGIQRVSQAVNRGDAEAVLSGLTDPGSGEAGELIGRRLPSRRELREALRERVGGGYGAVLRAPNPVAALAGLSQFRLLAAVREGPYGVNALNALTEEILREEGLLGRPEEWYSGRQVLVTANDYSVNLFNGDLGVVWRDDRGVPGVWFSEADGGSRRVAPTRLPAHETAFALTVHKSQGSEFTEVLLILPDRSQRVLTRELIYTGLTRARQRTEVWFNGPVLREAIAHRTVRASGLRERLWGGWWLVNSQLPPQLTTETQR